MPVSSIKPVPMLTNKLYFPNGMKLAWSFETHPYHCKFEKFIQLKKLTIRVIHSKERNENIACVYMNSSTNWLVVIFLFCWQVSDRGLMQHDCGTAKM